jgi:hypothetical protein
MGALLDLAKSALKDGESRTASRNLDARKRWVVAKLEANPHLRIAYHVQNPTFPKPAAGEPVTVVIAQRGGDGEIMVTERCYPREEFDVAHFVDMMEATPADTTMTIGAHASGHLVGKPVECSAPMARPACDSAAASRYESWHRIVAAELRIRTAVAAPPEPRIMSDGDIR